MALLTCPIESDRSPYDLDMVSVDGCLVFVSWDKGNAPHQYIVGLIKRLCALQGLSSTLDQHIYDGVLVGPCCIRYEIGSVMIDYAWTRTPLLL